ncbi:uncharacterized protein J3D65DRAFT_114413 [Phyllosticta citribraziliensis]|uniref:Uncharacterized protein n=1 Tax=Phyllosticta citribraziliensis TaxID=989973 RepID=A0ABR1L841_9PEZI
MVVVKPNIQAQKLRTESPRGNDASGDASTADFSKRRYRCVWGMGKHMMCWAKRPPRSRHRSRLRQHHRLRHLTSVRPSARPHARSTPGSLLCPRSCSRRPRSQVSGLPTPGHPQGRHALRSARVIHQLGTAIRLQRCDASSSTSDTRAKTARAFLHASAGMFAVCHSVSQSGTLDIEIGTVSMYWLLISIPLQPSVHVTTSPSTPHRKIPSNNYSAQRMAVRDRPPTAPAPAQQRWDINPS